MMGRKFIIVKPTKCCGYNGGVGKIRESTNYTPKQFIRCVRCGGTVTSNNSYIGSFTDGVLYFIHESRIKWLPDLNEQDELNQIKELEKEKQWHH